MERYDGKATLLRMHFSNTNVIQIHQKIRNNEADPDLTQRRRKLDQHDINIYR